MPVKIAHHKVYSHPLPDNHRFPMEKYTLLQGQLKLEGLAHDEDWICPTPMSATDILRTHDADYWKRLESGTLSTNDERRSGFKWSTALVLREQIIMQGTLECAQVASMGGAALNVAGGTHHAFAHRPEGFCLLNDLVLAADWLHAHQLAKSILVVDLDVHQGNGTAALAAHREHLYAFSMHGATNYPFHKEVSDLDVALADGADDNTYLGLLDSALEQAFDEAQPDVVLYQCGVDVLGSDKLGKLELSMEGCQARDERVFAACRKHDVGVACAMGGGYSTDVNRIVEAHMQTFRAARDAWT